MSFADELRSRSEEELTRLFDLRPDLITPVPADMSALSVRAASAPSLLRAMESLNQWQFDVLVACAVLEDPFTSSDVEELTSKDARDVIPQLLEIALIYMEDKKFRMPRSLRELIGDEPAGLGPRSASKVDFTVIAKAPKGAREILDRLTWGPPRGNLGDAKVKGGAIEWLLNNHLLIPMDSKTVSLPREVGLYLRGGKIYRTPSTDIPDLDGSPIKKTDSDRASLAAIANLLRLVQELMNFWAEETPQTLQTGGLGVRDLKKASEHLGIDESFTAFIAELSYLGGIVTIDSATQILPTTQFDIWQNLDPEDQWRELASLWRITSRVPGLIGRSDSRNITALGSELDRTNAARIRELTLRAFVPGLTPTLESLQKQVIWRYPHRRGISITNEMVVWTAREAEWLGITGGGALSSFGANFIADKDELGIAEALPKPVDHILIQSDNTAIAPGPLTIEIARQLSTFADIESRGGATVYRFSESSIRRGLDHGHSGDEIRTFLSKTSKTPVPQPLDYLITDVAKKHGRLRVGFAESYIRCEDPAIIASIIADKKLDHLGLRQIAPHVLVSTIESSEAIEELRNAGYFPAGENLQGTVITSPAHARAKVRPRPPRIFTEVTKPSDVIIKSAIRILKTGERAAIRKASVEIPRTTANETLDLLNEYLGKEVPLHIGYADTNGAVTSRIIDPISISLGTLVARDHATGGITPFKIARITGVTTA